MVVGFMRNLKLWFTNFWTSFDKTDNFFIYTLSKKYNITLTSKDPDLVITDDYRYRYQNAKMVYFSGEPFFNLGVCDYALTSFFVNDSRFFRIPLYLLYAYDYYKYKIVDSFDYILRRDISSFCLSDRENFCAYISRGPGSKSRRTEFFYKLNEYKKVNSLGSHLNNCQMLLGEPGTINGSIQKYELLKSYKFCMAFENSSEYDGCFGYTTEKIYEPFMSMCIPIYWGNEKVNLDFNNKSFVNWHDYGSDEKVIERIIEIDNDDDLYLDYIKESVVNSNIFDIDYLVQIFDKIIND